MGIKSISKVQYRYDSYNKPFKAKLIVKQS